MIRPAAPTDRAAILHVAVDSGLFTAEESAFLAEQLDAYFAGGQPGHAWTVSGDPVLGAAYVAPEVVSDRVWNLLFLAVAQAAQGTGTGSALVRDVEATLRAQDQRMLLIETSGVEGFEATRRFYTGLDYTEVARVPDFFSDGDDKVLFAKRL